jgi:phospholipid/cholesterol/gamma-HCH transport system ATP-binding protein
LITIHQLSYRVAGHSILRRLDLQIENGETVAVMGMSGVGKSTLLKCIGGLTRPTSGELIVDGTDIVPLRESLLREVRRKIGMVFQYAALFDSMNVFENVAFGPKRHLKLSEEALRDLVADKLALVGLSGTENLMPSQLSGGMQKRVGLARALALDPPILLYDEPTSGLDPITAATIGELIVDMRDKLGVTSVVVSHDIALIKIVANRIGMLHRGKIIAAGTRQEMEQSDNPIVRQFMEGSTEGPIKL